MSLDKLKPAEGSKGKRFRVGRMMAHITGRFNQDALFGHFERHARLDIDALEVVFGNLQAARRVEHGQLFEDFLGLLLGGVFFAFGIDAGCRAHLAHYKAPRHVVFDEIPKTSTGKIQKFRLREMASSL